MSCAAGLIEQAPGASIGNLGTLYLMRDASLTFSTSFCQLATGNAFGSGMTHLDDDLEPGKDRAAAVQMSGIYIKCLTPEAQVIFAAITLIPRWSVLSERRIVEGSRGTMIYVTIAATCKIKGQRIVLERLAFLMKPTPRCVYKCS